MTSYKKNNLKGITMRVLLLLRGVQGSGKSTWIKENGLEQYTLSADDFRNLLSNPMLGLNGKFHISLKKDGLAWKMLFACLEERMKKGDFTIIDATHSSARLCNQYLSLANDYKYKIYYLQFDEDLETCIQRNDGREEFKFVPHEVIERTHALIKNTNLPKKFTRIESLKEIENYQLFHANGYKKVKIIGDVHGCYDVLLKGLGLTKSKVEDVNINDLDTNNTILEKDVLYVFLGDLLDRGVQNKEIWDFMNKIVHEENVVVIEGNHELHLRNWAFETCEVRSKIFLNKTIPELTKGMNGEQIVVFKKKVRQFYRKLRQCFMFEFGGKKFLCTHGGLTSVPKLLYISSQQLIKGVGDHEDEICDIYEENYQKGLCQNLTQFHGHRTLKSSLHSYCLEQGVERGGFLKIAELSKDENGVVLIDVLKFKNTLFDKELLNNNDKVLHKNNFNEHHPLFTQNKEVNDMIQSGLVSTKLLSQGLMSINFKNKVFFKKLWNEHTIKARGLFIEQKTGKVALRSYNKFFNFKEREETSWRGLENLAYPVTAYVKENGFLGIMANYKDELVLCSKSQNEGLYKDYFQELVDRENKDFVLQLQELSKKYQCSFVFEVIHKSDPHIIEYEKEELVLLDAIPNSLHFNGVHVDPIFSKEVLEQVDFSKASLTRLKRKETVLQNFKELEEFIKRNDKFFDLEGFVLEDTKGFLFKLKCGFYSIWKFRRGLVYYYVKHYPNNFDFSKCRSAKDIDFMNFIVHHYDKDKLSKSNIIELRKDFFKHVG